MESYKTEFIDYAFRIGALKIGEFVLKSGRRSWLFFNVGAFSDGESIDRLGRAYAAALAARPGLDAFGGLAGPAYKGIPLVAATSIALSRDHGAKKWFAFDRKEGKSYGEATASALLAADIFVGQLPKDGDRIVILDDVITTGGTKGELIEKLNSVAKLSYAGLCIAVDRQELDLDGNNAVRRLEEQSLAVTAIITMNDIILYLAETRKLDSSLEKKIRAYQRAYGIEEVKDWCRGLKLIEQDKGIIPACDVSVERFEEIVRQTHDIEGVTAYKLGFELGLEGLARAVDVARKYTNKPLIYDHQKAGTDIPDLGKKFARACARAGIDAIILFPFSGPATQLEWIHSAYEEGLEVICGGWMTHPCFLRSEGGYIADEAPLKMYLLAAKAGVNNFVIPGNKKPEELAPIIETIRTAVPDFKPSFYSPGFVVQGGKIAEIAKSTCQRLHAIIGRAICEAKDVRQAAVGYLSQL